MNNTLKKILLGVLFVADALCILTAISLFTQGENEPAIVGVIFIAIISLAIKRLLNIKNNTQNDNLEDTKTKEVAGQLSLIKDLEAEQIEKTDENIEPREEVQINLPIYKDEDIEDNTDNNYQKVEHTHFDYYEPYRIENEPYYELYQVFENLQISDANKSELRNKVALLYSKYSTVPVYFQCVEYIKDFIETKVDARHKKNVSIIFLQILIERNNALIQEEIVKEEERMYRLKTKKGRLNSIARFKDNLYLYRDYFSPSNIDFLNNKIADLKTRYRLDEGEIIEQ